VRDYGKVAPTFWTGDTGRALRKMGSDVQLVALYLITGPHANMIGLYYMPLPTLCHETGLPLQGASKALRRLSEGGFAAYDEDSEVVWVPEMARYQLGDEVVPKDNRHKAILRELEKYKKTRFFLQFHERYGAAYHLPTPSPFEAPSKPLRSQEQEQEQEQETLSGPSDPDAAPKTKAKPKPKPDPTPRPRDPLFDAIAEVTGSDPHTAGSHVAKVRTLLAGAEPPYSPDEVRDFGRRFGVLCSWSVTNGKPRMPTVGELEKYIGRIRSAKPPVDPELEASREMGRRIAAEVAARNAATKQPATVPADEESPF
jgi:hypothetical protein